MRILTATLLCDFSFCFRTVGDAGLYKVWCDSFAYLRPYDTSRGVGGYGMLFIPARRASF